MLRTLWQLWGKKRLSALLRCHMAIYGKNMSINCDIWLIMVMLLSYIVMIWPSMVVSGCSYGGDLESHLGFLETQVGSGNIDKL